MLTASLWCLVVLSFVEGDMDAVEFCDWPRADGRTLSAEEFEELYLEKRPVVLTNLIDEWPAVTENRWTEERILQQYGNFSFDTSHIATNCRGLWEFWSGLRLAEFLTSGGPSSWFISGWHPMIRDMLVAKDFSRPKLLQSIANEGPSVSIGKKSQGNIFHDHDHNWLAQVHGSKRWLVLPPKIRPSPSETSSRFAAGPCAPRPTWEGISGCVVKAGEIAYVPSKWWHETCYQTDFSIGVAYVGSAVMKKAGDGSFNQWQAAIDGDVAALRDMSAELGSWDVNQRSQLDETAIQLAARHGHVETVRWLIHARADVNAFRNDSMPAAYSVANTGYVDIMKVLVENRASLQPVDTIKRNVLHSAALRGHVPMAEYLLDVAAQSKRKGDTKLLKSLDKNKMQPLHIAAGAGHSSCVEFLLTRRASVADGTPDTALFYASFNGHANAADFLLKHRADVGLQNSAGMQPAAAAAKAKLGSVRVLRVLLGARADLGSSENANGQTPMHVAAQTGHSAAVRSLFEMKAMLDPIAEGGVSPAHIAAFSGHADVMEQLGNIRANLNLISDDGYGPLHAAVQGGHVEVVNKLLEQRADASVKGPGNVKPLKMARDAGHKEIAKLLSKRPKKSKGNSEL